MVGDYGYSAAMSSVEVSASKFKATCLGLLDEVAASGAEYVVTKHGRPVARLVPVDTHAPLAGSVRTLSDPEDLMSTGESWHSLG